MITIMFHMTIRAGREDELRAVVDRLTRTTIAEDDGCLAYAFYRRADDAREAVLFEQWRDVPALDAHVARLQALLGPPNDEEPFPPTHYRRRLPRAFLDLFERTEAVRYQPMAE
jgi:quinol monooxygenase YgiN